MTANCDHEIIKTETVGHCNAHGEEDYQITQVVTYCVICGACLGCEVYDTRDEKTPAHTGA